MSPQAVSMRHPSWAVPLAAVAGSTALLLRPNVSLSLVTVGLVGAAGLVPADVDGQRIRSGPLEWLAAVVAGCAVFYAGRELGPPIGIRTNGLGIFAITFTAVAEEAFFRRFLYGRIARHRSDVIAVVATTLLFALIHVPAYGVAVLPIDVAAGALLGWQRYATGSWTAPAVTHLIANLMMMG